MLSGGRQKSYQAAARRVMIFFLYLRNYKT